MKNSAIVVLGLLGILAACGPGEQRLTSAQDQDRGSSLYSWEYYCSRGDVSQCPGGTLPAAYYDIVGQAIDRISSTFGYCGAIKNELNHMLEVGAIRATAYEFGSAALTLWETPNATIEQTVMILPPHFFWAQNTQFPKEQTLLHELIHVWLLNDGQTPEDEAYINEMAYACLGPIAAGPSREWGPANGFLNTWGRPS